MLSDIQIGMAIRSARLASNFSAKELSEVSGLKPSAISKIEAGKQTIGLAEAAEIAKALGVRVDHILTLAEEVAPLASKHESIREQLRRDLRELEKKTICAAIALGTNKGKVSQPT